MTQWTEFSFILKPSAISGIGVFATHDIPKGTELFAGKRARRKIKIVDVAREFLHFCIFINDEECFGPERFDRMDIGYFINHSLKPNIVFTSNNSAFSLYDIKSGDEILIDYNGLDEPEHMKKDFYRSS